MEKLKVTNGVYWVEVPEADLRVLCGCPADSIKHLMKRGLVSQRLKDGVSYETGPNAILLCDAPIQKGSFTNLSEFPVLQMLYRQGMLIPGHPNNTGRKPMLIGLEDQVRSQSAYIFRGNYGLATEDELVAAGVDAERAHEMMRIKRWFAFGNIRNTEELLDMRVVDKAAIELAPGVFIHRKGMNCWEFFSGGQSLEVDLNLGVGEEYDSPFELGSRTIRREYFSVIHAGEGDGWDTARPCMGSVLCFQGRLYLIDAGPGIMHSLTALGISVNEIEGIFQTHCHDDHFAGLTELVRSDRRLRYFAAPYVRASVEKKLAALMGIDSRRFAQLFEVHDLPSEQWTHVEGMDVRPVYSPHPVDTTVLFFRAQGEEGAHLYAHLADLPSVEVLDQMTTDDPKRDGISPAARERFLREMLFPSEVKKVDAGGGRIHGRPEDFAADLSTKIILSHSSFPLTEAQKEIGSSAAFGQSDVLIPVQHQTYLLRSAYRYFTSYFPEVPPHELGMLINCSIVTFNAGSLMIKKGARADYIYLILSGTAEVIDREAGFHNHLSAGALAGELSALIDEPSSRTFRADSAIVSLRIPCAIYRLFIKERGLEESVHRVRENRQLLFESRLFGEMASFTAHREIARAMQRRHVARGAAVAEEPVPSLCLLETGEVALQSETLRVDTVQPGDFWGESAVLEEAARTWEARALTDCVYFAIPASVLKEYPSVHLKLQETLDRRLKQLRMKFSLEWQESYCIGVAEIDQQHRQLFEMMGGLSRSEAAPGGDVWKDRWNELMAHVRLHFTNEEALLAARSYPRLDIQHEEHRKLLSELEALPNRLGAGSSAESLNAYLKDWLISHTLGEDRRLKDFFAGLRA